MNFALRAALAATVAGLLAPAAAMAVPVDYTFGGIATLNAGGGPYPGATVNLTASGDTDDITTRTLSLGGTVQSFDLIPVSPSLVLSATGAPSDVDILEPLWVAASGDYVGLLWDQDATDPDVFGGFMFGEAGSLAQALIDSGGPVGFTPMVFVGALETSMGALGSDSATPTALTYQAALSTDTSLSDVPLPAALPLAAAGFGLLAFVGGRRRR